jgi:translocation and assembly module TamB
LNRIWLAITLVFAVSLAGWAQDESDGSNSSIVRYIENSISSENRKIRLFGIDGLLASDARVEKITIADQEGVWLTINDAQIVWSRTALLRGRVEIERLAAASIDIPRAPLPEPNALPSPEAQGVSLPDLPVSVNIEALTVETLSLGEPLLGQPVEASLAGNLSLASGAAQAKFDMTRLDGAGGTINLIVGLSEDTRDVELLLKLSEPEDGLAANLLQIPGRPALDLDLSGSGKIEDLQVDLSLRADGRTLVEGATVLTSDPEGIGFSADVTGELDQLVAADFRSFFAGRSKVTAKGVVRDEGGLSLESAKIATGALELSGTLATTPDGMLRMADVTGRLGNGSGQTVLPVAGGQTSLKSADFSFDFGLTPDDRWSAELALDTLIAGDVTIGKSEFVIDGTATGLADPQTRRVETVLSGTLGAFSADDARVRRALGRQIEIALDTVWQPAQPFVINTAAITGNGVDISTKGEVENFVYNGEAKLRIDSLAPFSGFAGRTLSGGINTRLRGALAPLTGGFDLTLNGSSNNLRLDIDMLDRLTAGRTILSGQVIRDENGIATKNFVLENPQAKITSNGNISSAEADFQLDAALTEINVLRDDLRGAAQFSALAKGASNDINLNAILTLPEGELMAREVTALRANFDGALTDGELGGNIRGSGNISGEPINLFAFLEVTPESQAIQSMRATVGPSVVQGDIALDPIDQDFTGSLSVNSTDISAIAALLLQEASGAVFANLSFEPRAELGQQVEVDATLRNFKNNGVSLGQGKVNAVVYNALDVPAMIGNFALSDVNGFGVSARTATGRATLDDNITKFDIVTRLDTQTDIDISGDLEQTEDGFRLGLSRFTFANPSASLGLQRPASALISGSDLKAVEFALQAGTGTLIIAGAATDVLDLKLSANALPLSIANIIRPDLEADGALNGSIEIFGSRDNPELVFDLNGSGLTTTGLKQSDFPSIDLTTFGKMEDGITRLNAQISGPNDLTSTLKGDYTLSDGALNFEGDLQKFPLVVIDPLTGGLGLRGAIDGTFRILGTQFDPRVQFNLGGSGLTAKVLRDNAIPTLNISAEGSFYNNQIVLPDVRMTGGGGADFVANGRIPLWEDGLTLFGGGKIPLSVANVALAQSGVRAQGLVDVNLNASGSLREINTSGTLSLSGGAVVIPRANLRLEDIGLNGTFANDRFTINSASARNSQGGQISASGSINLNPNAGIPADITVAMRNMRYTDGRILTGSFGADLTFTGPTLRRPTLAGQIDVEEVEIGIPQAGTPRSDAYQLDVQHVNATPEIQATLARTQGTGSTTITSDAQGSDIAFDIAASAPGRVFVRGRGIDAEVGGDIRILGTARDPNPIGQLTLRRGRIQVLSQRITITSGAIVFDGELIPDVDVRARTVTEGIEATVALEGKVNKPEITFSSVPDLPDDEILARVAFGRSLSTLSPLQIAQVASAAAELSGRSSLSFFSTVRQATGLDDLDFETTEDGATRVRAGKYLQENVYTTVEADNIGNSKATINLDINSWLKARGSVDNQGNTSLGLFYEKDY